MSPDAAERVEAHEMLSRCIEFATTLGAEGVVTGGGDIPEATLEQKAERFGEIFPPFLEPTLDRRCAGDEKAG